MTGTSLPDYDPLVQQGHYGNEPCGMVGKYDNVRRCWENQITRFAVRDALARMRRALGRPMRICDLGSGSGEGLDLLLNVPGDGGERILTPADIACYHGVDLSQAMVDAGNARFAGMRGVRFDQLDLNRGVEWLALQPPFDLFYSCYGSLSHLTGPALTSLIGGMLATQSGPCTVVVDVHGRFSPEWPCWWRVAPEEGDQLPYSMTWLYPPHLRRAHRREFDGYRVRYWSRPELEAALLDAGEARDRLERSTWTDRSVLVGRHMDTREFNAEARPLRQGVNGLLEFNHRIAVEDLHMPQPPAAPDPAVAAFHREFTAVWNALVEWFGGLLRGRFTDADLVPELAHLPQHLLLGLQALAQQALAARWFRPGDVVTNLLQPQFALLLRQLEFHLQRGLGAGHGLLAVVEFRGR